MHVKAGACVACTHQDFVLQARTRTVLQARTRTFQLDFHLSVIRFNSPAAPNISITLESPRSHAAVNRRCHPCTSTTTLTCHTSHACVYGTSVKPPPSPASNALPTGSNGNHATALNERKAVNVNTIHVS
jgi:hypothetical protein